MVAGAAVQAMVMFATSAGGRGQSLGLVDLGQMALALQSHLLVAVPLWPEAFAATIIGLAFAAVLASRDPRRIRFAAIITLVAVAQLLATALKFAGQVHDLVPWQNGDRYFVLFRAVAWWLLLLAVLAIPRLPRRWAQGGFVAVLVLTAALANGPYLRQPALDDLQWQRHANCIDAGQAVRIPIHPRPWTIGVPGTSTGRYPCAD